MKPGEVPSAIITGLVMHLGFSSLSVFFGQHHHRLRASNQRRPLRHQPMTEKIR